MERTDDAHLLARARRAYEADRASTALAAAWPVVPMLALAVVLHRTASSVTLLVAGALALTLVLAMWRGGGTARGTRLGLIAGLPALVTPSVVAMLRGEHCSACLSHARGPDACFIACLTVSSLAGVAVGALAARDPHPARFVLGGVAAAALTGALACGLTGLGGGLGVAAGLAGSSVPALLVVRRLRLPA